MNMPDHRTPPNDQAKNCSKKISVLLLFLNLECLNLTTGSSFQKIETGF